MRDANRRIQYLFTQFLMYLQRRVLLAFIYPFALTLYVIMSHEQLALHILRTRYYSQLRLRLLFIPKGEFTSHSGVIFPL